METWIALLLPFFLIFARTLAMVAVLPIFNSASVPQMLKVGMGACGGKTCGPLIRAVFRREGVPDAEVVDFTQRPLDAEAPLGLFAGMERERHEDI